MSITTFNFLDELQFRSAAYSIPTQPVGWNVVFDCGHQDFLTDEQIHSPIESRKGSDFHFCRKCNVGDKSGTVEELGFYRKSVLHSITMATPVFGRHIHQAQGKQFKSASSTAENKEEGTPEQQAVDNWFALYRNVPPEQRDSFRKSLELSKTKPQLFTRLFASSDANHVAKESTDIIAWLKEEVQRLESSSST